MAIEKGLMAKLFKIGGQTKDTSIHDDVLQTHSPSLNFVFGNGWGLPRGFSLLLYGQPKGGKSLISRSMIGKMHQADDESVAVVFDTEMRWRAQVLSDPKQLEIYNVDKNRLKVIETNHPAGIFDVIEKELAALCDAGLKIGLVVIDSLPAIQGRRGTAQESIMTMQRGDLALTIQDGLKQILPTIRRHNISLILTTQIRDEQDPGEIMKRKKFKPAAAWATKHFCEYAMYVEPIDSQAGRKTISGEDLKDATQTVFSKDGEQIGHRIRARMTGSSCGPKSRTSEFTVHYTQGFINQHEEMFVLGVGSGAIAKPTLQSYSFEGKTWKGGKNVMLALREDPALFAAVLAEVKRRDAAHQFQGNAEIAQDVPETSDSEGAEEAEDSEE